MYALHYHGKRQIIVQITSLMEYTDDGDSESEVLGPVQESHQILDSDTTHDQSESNEPADLPPSHERSSRHADSQRARGTIY